MPLWRGSPVLRRTLGVFQAAPGIDRIQVVVASGDEGLYRAAVEGMDLPPPVAGGISRQQSVLNGLEALVSEAPDRVLIHDAARPYRRHGIDAVLAALDATPGAIPGLPVVDALWRAEDGRLRRTDAPRGPLARANAAGLPLRRHPRRASCHG